VRGLLAEFIAGFARFAGSTGDVPRWRPHPVPATGRADASAAPCGASAGGL